MVDRVAVSAVGDMVESVLADSFERSSEVAVGFEDIDSSVGLVDSSGWG